MSDGPVGPNRCQTCGGEYGEHNPKCITGQLKSRPATREEFERFSIILAGLRDQAESAERHCRQIREQAEQLRIDAEAMLKDEGDL